MSSSATDSSFKKSTKPSVRYQPLVDRRWFIRALEILPGVTTWLLLVLPVVLSIFAPMVVVYGIIAFYLFWLLRAFRYSSYLILGYRTMGKVERTDWSERVDWLRHPDEYLAKAERRMRDLLRTHPSAASRWQSFGSNSQYRQRYLELHNQIQTLRDIQGRQTATLDPDSIYHVVIMAVYNEARDIIEPSVKALFDVDYPAKKIMLAIAYEERGPEETKQVARELADRYADRFGLCVAIEHPDGIAGEVIGKGGNITNAGRQLAEQLQGQGLDPERVVVTTFDSDHRASRQYFSVLTYLYCIDPNRSRKSFQPVPMFYNNIWDAPAPMRIIATNNSFWHLIETMRPHRLRNFSAHAQGLRALLDTDFWSVSTPVEDGHQYWRSWLAFDGDHQVVPMYTPVFQDAVLAETYPKTFVAQYKQLRRWAYGISDFPYVVRHCLINSRIGFWNKSVHVFRLLEGHIAWSTTALIVTFGAWLPLFLNERFSRQELAHQLPVIASNLQNIALVGLIIMVAISMISLPPRPARYRSSRRLFLLLQWVLVPVVSIAFSATAAIDAQTRLMLGKYLAFQVTPKSRRK
ncbi:hypothetical protein EPO04_02670 [Patescibacteria group bacterium]|nr:MAG: hypothetical protein EPO04_02670 [Patescibacteria group bacterium]